MSKTKDQPRRGKGSRDGGQFVKKGGPRAVSAPTPTVNLSYWSSSDQEDNSEGKNESGWERGEHHNYPWSSYYEHQRKLFWCESYGDSSIGSVAWNNDDWSRSDPFLDDKISNMQELSRDCFGASMWASALENTQNAHDELEGRMSFEGVRIVLEETLNNAYDKWFQNLRSVGDPTEKRSLPDHELPVGTTFVQPYSTCNEDPRRVLPSRTMSEEMKYNEACIAVKISKWNEDGMIHSVDVAVGTPTVDEMFARWVKEELDACDIRTSDGLFLDSGAWHRTHSTRKSSVELQLDKNSTAWENKILTRHYRQDYSAPEEWANPENEFRQNEF